MTRKPKTNTNNKRLKTENNTEEQKPTQRNRDGENKEEKHRSDENKKHPQPRIVIDAPNDQLERVDKGVRRGKGHEQGKKAVGQSKPLGTSSSQLAMQPNRLQSSLFLESRTTPNMGSR